MANLPSRRYDSLLLTNREIPLVTRTSQGTLDVINNIIENTINEYMYVTVSSNNLNDRFTAKTGNIIYVYVITMTTISDVNQLNVQLLDSNGLEIGINKIQEKINGIWRTSITVPDIQTQLGEFAIIQVKYNNKIIPYTKTINNQIMFIN